MKITRLKLFLLGGSLFLFFVFFSYLVHKDLFTQFDFNMTVRLQDKIPVRFDPAFSQLSQFGNFEVLTIVLVLILVFRRKLWGIIAFGLYGGLHLIEIYGKSFVSHPPPPQFMIRVQTPIDFPKFHVRTENSYPSGHAARTIFISILLFFVIYNSKKLSREVKFMLYGVIALFDILMFISRPYLGEHWTSDVIGGILLGAGLAIVSEAFLLKSRWDK
jgi:undecaprenyl-diphosphatase